ncbi:MAG: hypothetical protein FWC47_01550 [Oscillospiraceae bacterium]|nr:hypothetical protein [Oscillospiraceae bacterium]
MYVIGIDGGSSKSHLAIFDLDGNFVCIENWGTLNHEALPGSFAQFEAEFTQFVTEALASKEIKIDEIEYAVIGMSGVDTKEQHRIISAIVKNIGFKEFTLCNDAYLGIPGVSSENSGICAINGTGCSIAGMNEHGKMFQIGGLGTLTGDFGGGYNIGTYMVRAVYNSLFRLGEPTLLKDMLFKELDISDKYDFIETLSKRLSEGSFRLGANNKLLFEAERKGDAVAKKIISEIAESYANGIVCMIREIGFEQNVDIALAGSVFAKEKDSGLIKKIKEIVCDAYPEKQINFVVFEKPPVAGAVIWALRVLNPHIDFTEKVFNQL